MPGALGPMLLGVLSSATSTLALERGLAYSGAHLLIGYNDLRLYFLPPADPCLAVLAVMNSRTI